MTNTKFEMPQEAKAAGFSLYEPDDHILELYLKDKIVARFNQTSVDPNNILKEIKRAQGRI